ncbi:uncharacterized protein [Typha angustifolia]|uniref:uncharacterized protein n=1 Tax=Typha angustifolia TaxID=59011 RepID=UPI003C2B79FF
MGSTTSGSMQSSSGGAANEEYTSNPEPISSLLTITSTSPFDSFSNYLDFFPRPTNYTNMAAATQAANNIPTPSSSSIDHDHAHLQPQPPPSPSNQPTIKPAARGSKKRSRASRRPPTTVMTTDTSNFRAMVQEFTGFPTPHFAATPFVRPRISPLQAGGAAPPYLSRPFPHKVQVAPPFPSIYSSSSTTPTTSSSLPNSMIDAIASIATNSINATNVNSFFTNPTPPTAHGQNTSLVHQQLNLLDFPIPAFSNFQSQPNIPFLGNPGDQVNSLSTWGEGLELESSNPPTRFKPDIRDYINSQRSSGGVDVRFSSSETGSHVLDLEQQRR